MRKPNKEIIFSALAAAALGLTTVGTTFALFTDKAETAVEIEAGKIETSATMTLLNTYSAKAGAGTLVDEFDNTYILEQQPEGKFVNGGTASVSGTTLSLERITPGDKATFRVHLSNTSNIAVKARLKLTVPEEDYLLASALDLTIGLGSANEDTRSAVSAYYSSWMSLAPSVDTSRDFDFALFFPIDKGNIYQAQSADYTIVVETVQGNALVTGNERYYSIESQAAAVNDNEVNLGQDINGDPVLTLTQGKSVQSSAPNSTTETVTVDVPTGVTLENGTKAITLVVSETETNPSVAIESGEEVCVSYNLDVNGVASTNTTPITVTVPYSSPAAPTKIVHTKDNGTTETILPKSELNPNGFEFYNGYIVFKTTSFSLFTVVTENARIYFEESLNWGNVYAYMWTESGGNKVENHAFPGVKMTLDYSLQESGTHPIYYIECEDYENVIFSDGIGGNGEQTVDIVIQKGHKYYLNGSWTPQPDNHAWTSDYLYKSVFFTKPDSWASVYVYFYNSDSDKKMAWPGYALDLTKYASINEFGQNIYRTNCDDWTYVIFNNGNGNGKQTADITVTPGETYYVTGDNETGSVGHVTYEKYCGALADAIRESVDGGTIKLYREEFVVNEPFDITKDITIDLHGFNIRYTGDTQCIFRVAAGKTLTLIDSDPKTQYGYWTEVNSALTYVVTNNVPAVDSYTTFTGGVIYGGKGISFTKGHEFVYDKNNGGAIINRGTLIIDGVNIAGNIVEGNAAGISNVGGTVTFKSGKITDNKAPNGSGAAIYNDLGTFNMEGGEISNNTAIRGAIIVRGATFNLSGGVIENNTASRYMIDVTPNPEVEDPTPYGVVNFTGGTIRNNTTTNNVGGAFNIREGCTLNMTGGLIEGNHTHSYIAKNDSADLVYSGGAIAFLGNGIANLHGGQIIDNVGGGVACGDQGGRVKLGGSIKIAGNTYDGTTPLNVFMDGWLGKCPVLDIPFTEGAEVSFYEGHFLNDPDTYGCVLKIGYDEANPTANIMPYVHSDRSPEATLIYQADCYSNVGLWNHEAYIRQVRA